MTHLALTQPAARSLWQKLEDYLFGPTDLPWSQGAGGTDDPLLNDPKVAPDLPPPPPSTPSWLQAFNNSLTHATALFIRDYVEPLHADDPSTGFAVRAIDAALPDANFPGLRTIADMPAETRNRIAMLRCLKAAGAKEQLEFDKFYGLNIVAADSLVEGFLVRTLVASDGMRLNVTFRFSGEYVTLKTPAAPDVIATPTPAAAEKKPTAEVVAAEPELVPPPVIMDDIVPEAPREYSATPLRATRPQPEYSSTPLRAALGKEQRPIFYVTVLEPGSDRRIPIYADAFPVSIGCDPKGKTDIVVHPHRLSPAGEASFVSAQHLELVEYDAATRIVFVKNLGKNGSYFAGAALPERFTLSPSSKKTLLLGGPEGEGVAQVRIEAA